MKDRRAGERGQVAVYAVVLFPMLMLVLALVLAVGTIEGLRTRLRAQLDMAALTATQALDPAALAAGAPPRLQVAEAERLAGTVPRSQPRGDRKRSLWRSRPDDRRSGGRLSSPTNRATDPTHRRLEHRPDPSSIEIVAPARIPLLGRRRNLAHRDPHDRRLRIGEDVT